MKESFWRVKRSWRTHTLPKKVKSDARLARMVFEVTDVRANDALKVHCAKYHNGATYYTKAMTN